MEYNALIFLIVAILDLSIVLLAWRLGKSWLTATILANIVLANIFVGKMITIFGWTTTAGEVFYASIFIATDILSEHHGKKEGYRSIWMGFLILAMFTLLGRLALEFVAMEDSAALAGALESIFTTIPRIVIASFTAYLAAQSFDIWFFHKLKEKTKGGKLWLRNNLSTVSSQLLDSMIFFPLAFYGTVPMDVLYVLILTGWLFKVPVALLDTPFMYLSYVIKGKTPPDFDQLKRAKMEAPAAGLE